MDFCPFVHPIFTNTLNLIKTVYYIDPLSAHRVGCFSLYSSFFSSLFHSPYCALFIDFCTDGLVFQNVSLQSILIIVCGRKVFRICLNSIKLSSLRTMKLGIADENNWKALILSLTLPVFDGTIRKQDVLLNTRENVSLLFNTVTFFSVKV